MTPGTRPWRRRRRAEREPSGPRVESVSVESSVAMERQRMVAEPRLSPARDGYSAPMSPDEELVVIFGVLHLVALALGVVLFVMFLRSEAGPGFRPPEDDEGGGGGNDRISDRPPHSSPSGGVPLPD